MYIGINAQNLKKWPFIRTYDTMATGAPSELTMIWFLLLAVLFNFNCKVEWTRMHNR